MFHSFQAARLAGAILLASILAGCSLLPPDLPEREAVTKRVWLNQGWDSDMRFWFHHASQGTSTLPVSYRWFMALEQPSIRVFGDPALLSDPAYLERFGFISSPRSTAYAGGESYAANGYGTSAGTWKVAYDSKRFPGNADGLPVGFARTPGYVDPATGEDRPDQIGLNCAACHTGQMTYRGTNIRIDGAPGVTNLSDFRTVLGLSLAYTKYLPGRFDRFADRVLGPDSAAPKREELKLALDRLLEQGAVITEQMNIGQAGSIEEGFTRLDALNRIGTQMFYTALLRSTEPGFDAAANLYPNNAPVSYPPIWSASWFDMVQYDASIHQPMIRNAGEALGVAARVNLVTVGNPKLPLYGSSVDVGELVLMEELLAGPNPQAAPKQFKGLSSPAWPEDILGRIDRAAAERGATLYGEHCSGCHRPPPNDPASRFWDNASWTPSNAAGLQFYKAPVIPVGVIGTDPAQSDVLATRRVKVPAYLGISEPTESEGMICAGPSGTAITETSFGWALAAVTGKVVDRWYADRNIPAADQARMNGNRDNCIRASAGYKARPLNGMWATAPFLHNGAVPSLYDLLSPAAERPKVFCLGNLEFDPVRLGYDPTCRTGTTRIDTAVRGNWNTGHSFESAPAGKGVIGPALSPADRLALIEYLKTL